MKHRKSDLWERARAVIPGGVNSPVRSFKAVGMDPLFVKSAAGSRIRTTDGKVLIDYVCSWGPLILGHAHPVVMGVIEEAVRKGASYGMPTENEVKLAEMIVEAVPSIEKVRLTSSGTEAVMSAVRLARAFTGRDRVIKFAGCYHGHSDGLLVKAGSGATTLSVPDSAGVPKAFAEQTILLPYNNLPAVEEAVKEHAGSVACVILEPAACNMGLIKPAEGFLEGLRRLTADNGSLLIFDEIITGFRLSYGGAQELYGVIPDLTTLGKILGGGLPIGAFGGRGEIMDMLAPDGPVYQAGTLSGNPLATAAGIATLSILSRSDVYDELERKGAYMERGLTEAAANAGIRFTLPRVGSMFSLFFTDRPVKNWEDARASDTERFALFFREMLKRGVLLPPSQFETSFISLAHSERDIESTIAAAREALASLPP